MSIGFTQDAWQTEDEEDDSYETAVASAVSNSYVPINDPENPGSAGPMDSYVPPAESYFPTDAPDAGSGYAAINDYGYGPAPVEVTPAVQTGSNFFGEHGLELAEQQMGPQQSVTQIVDPFQTASSYFDNLYTEMVGNEPTPWEADGQFGEGSLWFGTEEEQERQIGYWEKEANAAIQNGDMEKYNQLVGERDRAMALWGQYETDHAAWADRHSQFVDKANAILSPMGEGPADLYLRGAMDQVGTPDHDYNAQGEIMLRSDLRRELLNQENNAAFGNSLGQIDAETAFLNRREGMSFEDRQLEAQNAAYFNTQQNIQRGRSRVRPDQQGSDFGTTAYGPAPDPFLGGPVGDFMNFTAPLAGTALGFTANEVNQALTAEAFGRSYAPKDAIGDAWAAMNYSSEKGGQAASYLYYLGSPAVRGYYTEDEVEQIKAQGGGMAYARARYDAQSGFERLAFETVGDPLNWIPVGGLAKIGGTRLATWNRARILKNIEGGMAARVFDADETRLLVENLGYADLKHLPQAVDEIGAVMKANGLKLNSTMDFAVAYRLAGKGAIHKASGGVIDADFIDHEIIQQIDRIADAAGATPAESQKVSEWLVNNRMKLAETTDSAVTPTEVSGIIANPQTPEEAIHTASEVLDIAETQVVPSSEVMPLFDNPQPITTARMYMDRHPGEVLTGTTGHIGPLIQPTENQLTALQRQAQKSRIRAWNPLQELADLPPEQRTFQRVSDMFGEAPPTKRQLEKAKSYLRQKRLTADEVRQIQRGDLNALQTGDLLDAASKRKPGAFEKIEGDAQSTAIELAGKGHDVPVVRTDPAFDEKLTAAEQDAALRQREASLITQMLPRTGKTYKTVPEGYTSAAKGAFKTALGDQEVMDFARLQRFLARHWDELPNDSTLALFAADIIRTPLYTKFDATISTDTAQAFMRARLDDLVSDMAAGRVPTEDLRQFRRLLKKEYTDSPTTVAEAERAAARRLEQMSEAERTRTLERTARLKTENDALLTQFADLKRQRATNKSPEIEAEFQRVRRKIEENTHKIIAVEPGYTTKLPKKPRDVQVAERDAAQDVTLQAEGVALQPSSPPSRGIVPETVGPDSTRDVLAQAEAVPVGSQGKIAYDPREGMTDADIALMRGEGMQALDEPFIEIGLPGLAGAGGDTHSINDVRRYIEEARELELDAMRVGRSNFSKSSRQLKDAQRRYEGSAKQQRLETLQNFLGELDDKYPGIRQQAEDLGAIPKQTRTRRPKAEKALPGNALAADPTWDRQVRNMFRSQGNLDGMAASAFTRRGTTKAAVEAHLRQGGDIAAGGGMGIVHPAMQRLMRPLREPKPVIDFHADAWRNFNWDDAEQVRAFDKIIDDLYKVDDFPPVGNQKASWSIVKQSQITKTTDLFSNYLSSWMDEAYQTADPIGFMRDRLSLMADTSATPEMIASELGSFFTTKHGAEVLRAWRTHGDDVLKQWDKLNPYQTIARYGDGWLPEAVNSVYDGGALSDIDRLVMGNYRPTTITDQEWEQLQNFRRAFRGTWKEQIRPLAEMRGNKRVFPDLHIDQLDSRLFPKEADKPVDIRGTAERIAGMVADLEAKRIGFDANDVPWDLKIMQGVKANFTPFWMTFNPSYTINNAGGNLASQIIGALRSDLHGGIAHSGADAHWKAALSEAGSGITRQRYLDSGLTRSHTHLTETLTGKAEKRSLADKAIHSPVTNVPGARVLRNRNAGEGYQIGLGGYHDAMVNINDNVERFFKDNIFSNEFMHTYRNGWREAVERTALERGVKDDLVQAVGLKQLTLALEKHGVDDRMRRQLLAEMRGTIAQSNLKAYDTTATILRDYRIRNRMDGILDRFIPVHYWTTKNALFVGSVVADRPGLVVAGANAYDAWQKENEGLPPSFRVGLVPIPGDMIPGYGDDKTWHLRVSQYINPALFVVPKLANPDAYQWEGTSLPDRLKHAAAGGLSNLWEASGYRIGPQFDLAEQLAEGGARFLGASGDELPFRVARNLISPLGYKNEIIPYQTQVQRWSVGRQAMEHYYQFVYGTPYNRAEMTEFYRAITDQERTGKIEHDDALALFDKLNKGQFNDPAIKKIVDNVLGDRANLQLVAKAGASGKEYVELWRKGDEANETFQSVKDRAGLERAKSWARDKRGNYERYFKEYVQQQVQQGALDQQAADVALRDVLVAGNLDNPLFQDAVAAAQRRLEKRNLGKYDADTLRLAVGADNAFETVKETKGIGAAYKWMEAENPWLVGYWASNDEQDKVREYLTRQAAGGTQDAVYQAAQEYYEALDENRNQWAPFYARMDRIRDASDKARGRAQGDPLRLALADRTERDAINKVYDDAEAAGLELLASDRLPRQGREFYTRGMGERRFLEANGALEAVQDYDRQIAQRNHIMEMVRDELGLDSMSEEFQNERGFTDWDAFNAAVKERAPQAPRLYMELVDEFIRAGSFSSKSPLDGGVYVGRLVNNITEADFIKMFDDRYPYEKAAQEDINAYMDLPKGEEKDAAREALFAKYGEDVLDIWFSGPKNATEGFAERGETETGSRNANTTYADGIQTINNIFFQMTPREKSEFQERYGSAFVEGEDGYPDFVKENLTYEQVLDFLDRNNIQADGTSVQPERRLPSNYVPGQATAPERERVKELSDQIKAALPEGMTQEEADLIIDQFDSYITTEGATPFNGTTLEEAAQALIGSPQAITKKGFPSWKLAEIAAGEGTVLGEYIRIRKELSDQRTPIFDARDAVRDGLPEKDQELLRRENPSLFKYSGGGSSTSSSNAPESSGTSTFTSNGSSGSFSSNRSSYTPFRSSGGNSRSSGGGSSQQANSLGFSAQSLFALDPVLSAGQDDGRGAVVTQIGSLLTSRFAFLDMLPNGMGRIMLGLWMNWLGQQIGNEPPTMQTWQKILALLQSPQQEKRVIPVDGGAKPQAGLPGSPGNPLPPPPSGFQSQYGY